LLLLSLRLTLLECFGRETSTQLLCEWFFVLFKKDKIEAELATEHQFWHHVIRELITRFINKNNNGVELADDMKKALSNANTVLDPFVEYFDAKREEDYRIDEAVEEETVIAGRYLVELFVDMAGIVLGDRTRDMLHEIHLLRRAELEELFLRWSVFVRIAGMARDAAKPVLVDIIFDTLPVLYIQKQAGVPGMRMRLGIYLDLVQTFYNERITEQMVQRIVDASSSSSSSPESSDSDSDGDGSVEDDGSDASSQTMIA